MKTKNCLNITQNINETSKNSGDLRCDFVYVHIAVYMILSMDWIIIVKGNPGWSRDFKVFTYQVES